MWLLASLALWRAGACAVCADHRRRRLQQRGRSTRRRLPIQGRPGPGGYGSYRGYGARDYALNRGFNDGYEQGFEAARDRDRFDPRRERWYRDAERGYDRDYRMSRNEYRDVYRRGFLEGYESGYRDAQRGWRGGTIETTAAISPPQGGWRR